MSDFVYFGRYRIPRDIVENHVDPPRIFADEEINKAYIWDTSDEGEIIFVGFYSAFGEHRAGADKSTKGWHPRIIVSTIPFEIPEIFKMTWDKHRQNFNLVDAQTGEVYVKGEDNFAREMANWILHYELHKHVSIIPKEKKHAIVKEEKVKEEN
jgi:hypothetical protein